MKTSPPILLYTLSILLASGVRQGFSSLLCLYDSLQTIDCAWTPMKNATEAARCRLTGFAERASLFSHEDQSTNTAVHSVNLTGIRSHTRTTCVTQDLCKTCQLQGVGNRSCQLIFNTRSLTVSDTITLVVSCRTGENEVEVDLQKQMIKPFQNIQLKPPCDIQLENASKPSYNLTWKLCVLSHYLPGWLEYEVQYQRKGAGEDPIILPIVHDQKWLKFEALPPDTEFEAAVRVKTQTRSNYNSIWSKWSKPRTWRTYSNVSAQTALVNLQILVSVLVGSLIAIFLITVALMANSQTSKWLRKLLKIHLPDPSSFFPSLTAVHGDIQKWLSSPLSMASFHITAASPDVSALEIIQKGDHQEPYFLLSKEYLSPVDTAETSGHSTSSCFTNHGYFFFRHVDSLEIEPCKVYFTYDPFAQESSGSEDGDSCPYRALHAADDNLPFPSYGIMGSKDVASFLPETMDPTQKAGGRSEIQPSVESFTKTSAVEQTGDEEGSEAVSQSLESPPQSVMVFSGVPEQSISNTNKTEAIGNTVSHTRSVENRSPFLHQGQSSNLCRAVSLSRIFNEEAYVSLRDIQNNHIHHSL